MTSLWTLSARDMVGALRRRMVSPLEAVNEVIARIESTDSLLNAIPIRCFDRARARAMELSKRSPTGEAAPLRLYGLPIAVKDNTDVEGVPTTHGSLAFAKNVPRISDVAVQRLEAAGAIVVGKTNIPEFSAGGTTYNELFGTTGNPWGHDLTPGGSSGGSAAALASGQVWLATGNDLGGSIRGPAALCGVVGLRPSPGRVPRRNGRYPLSFLSVEGPMARNVPDLAMMFDVEAGPDPSDVLSMGRTSVPSFAASQQPALPPRIAYSDDLGLTVVDSEVRAICRSAVGMLESHGALLTEAHPDLRDAAHIGHALRGLVYVGRVGALIESGRASINPDVMWNAEAGLALSARQIAEAESAWSALLRRTGDFFEQYDLLICPATITAAFDKRKRFLRELCGHKFGSYIEWLNITHALSLTACPILAMPCGFTSTGLPVGIQVAARPYEEHFLIAAGAFLEEIFGVASRVPIDPRSSSSTDTVATRAI